MLIFTQTIEYFAMIITQSRVDIFFIDWEKPKQADMKVSTWRTYFVANEWHEIQVRRSEAAQVVFAAA